MIINKASSAIRAVFIAIRGEIKVKGGKIVPRDMTVFTRRHELDAEAVAWLPTSRNFASKPVKNTGARGTFPNRLGNKKTIGNGVHDSADKLTDELSFVFLLCPRRVQPDVNARGKRVEIYGHPERSQLCAHKI